MSKLCVNGVELFYQKHGTGDHVVLLLPGGLGFGQLHFTPQIQGFDKKKFTLISWDPRGYGQSRPPKRVFPKDFYYIDADDAIALMEKLGYTSYSILGWSDGAIVACIIAAKQPNRIRRIVMWGGNAMCPPEMLQSNDNSSNSACEDPEYSDPSLDYYGKEYFTYLTRAWAASFHQMDKDSEGNIDLCSKCLPKVTAPTFILHGLKDVSVVKIHADHMHKNIAGSRLVLWENGEHSLHLQFPDDFNKIAQQFLLESS
uniref:Valacyclovir hydrolase-like n=1 Tax=Ciona intestinalis TaxID=7719 RepID=F6XA69_CIOIN|nr:valacyclovir hydrolase-like [Ciona intestinalis]|eukprot:XP_002126774.1 valacyclovir hydrolase-like [Ciona intestinalis]